MQNQQLVNIPADQVSHLRWAKECNNEDEIDIMTVDDTPTEFQEDSKSLSMSKEIVVEIVQEEEEDEEESEDSILIDLQARDFWESYERKIYQQSLEKKEQEVAKLTLMRGNRKTPEQLKQEKELEKLIHINIFAPVDDQLMKEIDQQPYVRPVKKRIVLPTPSYRDFGEVDDYDPTITESFYNDYKYDLISCDVWTPVELRTINMKKKTSIIKKKKPKIKPKQNQQLSQSPSWIDEEKTLFKDLLFIFGPEFEVISELMMGLKTPEELKLYYDTLDPLEMCYFNQKELKQFELGFARNFRASRIITNAQKNPKLKKPKKKRKKTAEVLSSSKIPLKTMVFAFYQHPLIFSQGGWFEAKVIDSREIKEEDGVTDYEYLVHIPQTHPNWSFWVSGDRIQQTLDIGIEVWEYCDISDELSELHAAITKLYTGTSQALIHLLQSALPLANQKFFPSTLVPPPIKLIIRKNPEFSPTSTSSSSSTPMSSPRSPASSPLPPPTENTPLKKQMDPIIPTITNYDFMCTCPPSILGNHFENFSHPQTRDFIRDRIYSVIKLVGAAMDTIFYQLRQSSEMFPFTNAELHLLKLLVVFRETTLQCKEFLKPKFISIIQQNYNDLNNLPLSQKTFRVRQLLQELHQEKENVLALAKEQLLTFKQNLYRNPD